MCPRNASREILPGPKIRIRSPMKRKTNGSAAANLLGSEKKEKNA
jgi:hypothetical protein